MQDSLVGRSLREGEYVVRDVLGKGGMATVYRAYSRSLETDVALKVLAPRLAADLDLRDKLHEEARLLSRLFHPNLLTVHYFGEEDQVVYIAMRLVSGGTLRDRLSAMGGTLDLVSAARLIQGVADALQAAHDANIVHLDVKPTNVLLGRADWPLLADTGIAEVIQTADVAPGGRRIAGTPAYMSPEQCRGDAVDGRSDQYSLAVSAYQLLTGQVPFDAPTTQDLMRRQIHDPPPPPRQLNPGLPSPIEDILMRGLAKDPADRFPRVADFGQALADAAERTRGMSLATKTSLADAAPNIVATLLLLVLGPMLLALLPGDAQILGVVPLGWPFQLALAISVSGLLLGIRWHVVGLVARAGGALVDAIERVSRGAASRGARLASLRTAVVGSAEGVVNLVYLLGLYHLVGMPLIGVVGALLEPGLAHLLELGLLGLVTLGAFGIVAAIARSAGLGAAIVVLGLAWAMTSALSSVDLGPASAVAAVSAVRLLVGTGILAVLLSRRQWTAMLLGNVALGALGRLMVESRPDASPEALLASRKALTTVTAAVLDVVYLLLGYAILRLPLVEELGLAVGPLTAAALVTAAAVLIWALLTVRLYALSGVLGVVLGLLLGAPLLLSLPILEQRVVNAAWPATTAAWVVGIGLLLLLVGLRSRVHAFVRPGLGARLDRGMLGMYAAPNEQTNQRRQGAFGRIASALIDVAFLVLAYWVLGVPVAAALVRSTGYTWVGTAVLGLLLASVVGVMGTAALQTRRTLAETGGAAWRARAGAMAALGLVFLPLLVVGGAAVPAALASPAAAGSLELQPIRVPLVIVDWDFWLPLTPRQDQATYQLSLSCTDGRRIGQFHETFQPAAGARLPAGRVGELGPTTTACDNWPAEYAARRAAAGLGETSSLSWDGLDVRATVNADDSVDVVETHRIVFTAGQHDHLAVKVGAPAADLDHLSVTEGNLVYAIEPPAPEPARYARSWEVGDQYWVGWWFPDVVSPSERTYIVSYRLNHAVRSTPDARRALAWRLAAPDALEPIWLATVQVRLPTSIDPGAVRLTVDGVPARSELLAGQTAWFATSGAIAERQFDTAVDFPSSAPPGGATPTPTSTRSSSGPTATQPAQSASAAATSAAGVAATSVVSPPAASPSPAATGTPTAAPSPTRAVAATPTGVATPPATPTDVTPPTATPTEVPPATDTPTTAPTPSPTDVATPTPTPTDVATATATPTPTDLGTPTATPTQAPTPTETPTPPPTPTEAPTPTDTPAPTPPPTDTPTPAPTATSTPVLLEIPPPPLQGETRFGIDEGFRNPAVMADTKANWERIVLSWRDIQPNSAGDFGRLGQTINTTQIQGEISRGTRLAGLLQFTPGWAQANPDQGERSPPRNLDLAFDDPNNYWGQFVYQTVKFYAGRVDEWVIWNEPEFKPNDAGAGGSTTWLGSDAEFAQLLKVAYLAAKKANPNATVSFPGTSYWIDQTAGRPQFYDRLLQILRSDPDAAHYNFYHDVVALNLYRAPDDLLRVYEVFKTIQTRYRVDKPVWLTESNAMPTDDKKLGNCDHGGDAIKTTLEEQASFSIQAFAMAAATSYNRIGFYQMIDANPCAEPAVWGVVRDDGSKRPVEDSLRTAITNFLGFAQARFVPLPRIEQAWAAWPDDPNSYTPNWEVYQVAMDKPGRQRVSVLWNGDGPQGSSLPRIAALGPAPPAGGLVVRIPKHGSGAHALDKYGQPYPYFQEQNGWWVMYLKPATATYAGDPPGYHYIGGDPVLIVEDGVNASSPVGPPELLSDASSTPAAGGGDQVPVGNGDFRLAVAPADGQTILQGESADYSINTQALNGFSGPIELRIVAWSTQRFPNPRPGDTLPFGVSLPASTTPGRPARLHIETSVDNDVGIYFLTLQASGAGLTKTIDVALVVDPGV
jgi:serine/threonine-protein kinase